MVLTGPQVTETRVMGLLKEHDINLSLCGKGTHFPLPELMRRMSCGEVELVTTAKERRIEVRQTLVVVRVLHTQTDLSHVELYKACTIFSDKSSLTSYTPGLTAIHNSEQSLEETARRIVIWSLGDSEPKFLRLKPGRFSKKPDRSEVLVTDRSHLWYGMRAETIKIHIDLIIPKDYFKEKYTKRIRTASDKIFQTSYFAWRPISGPL